MSFTELINNKSNTQMKQKTNVGCNQYFFEPLKFIKCYFVALTTYSIGENPSRFTLTNSADLNPIFNKSFKI